MKVSVIGLGYVGLPTAATFASEGFNVIGIDIDEKKVHATNKGSCYIREPGLDDLVREVVSRGMLRATTDVVSAVKKSDAVIVAVNTPVRDGVADLSQLVKALSDVKEGLKEGQLVVIESTVPPGTTSGLAKRVLEGSGLRAEKDFYLAHVPERIAPGRALEELRNAPRVIGGIGPESSKKAYELYSKINKKLYVTDATTAEFIKLIENIFRDLNIAYANLLALMAEKLRIDVYEAIRLANTHPRVNIHMPGAGVGGPCLTKDPYLLLSAVEDIFGTDLIKIARKINDYMPLHIVNTTIHALKKENVDLVNAKIVILGTAYKGDVNDVRESPAKKVIGELLKHKLKVVTYDPYTHESFGAERAENIEDAVKDADVVIIITDHKEFKNLDWLKLGILMRHKIIIDGRRILEPKRAIELGFKYYGVGYGRC